MKRYYDNYQQVECKAPRRSKSYAFLLVLAGLLVASALLSSCTTQSQLCEAYGTQHYYDGR